MTYSKTDVHTLYIFDSIRVCMFYVCSRRLILVLHGILCGKVRVLFCIEWGETGIVPIRDTGM